MSIDHQQAQRVVDALLRKPDLAKLVYDLLGPKLCTRGLAGPWIAAPSRRWERLNPDGETLCVVSQIDDTGFSKWAIIGVGAGSEVSSPDLAMHDADKALTKAGWTPAPHDVGPWGTTGKGLWERRTDGNDGFTVYARITPGLLKASDLHSPPPTDPICFYWNVYPTHGEESTGSIDCSRHASVRDTLHFAMRAADEALRQASPGLTIWPLIPPLGRIVKAVYGTPP